MIGKTIKKIRKSQGITLSQLAERSNISKSYLSNIERNVNQNPSVQIVEKIAQVLKVDCGTLLKKPPVDYDFPEDEWLNFVKELKRSGVQKDQLQEYKTVIEFAKWKKDKES